MFRLQRLVRVPLSSTRHSVSVRRIVIVPGGEHKVLHREWPTIIPSWKTAFYPQQVSFSDSNNQWRDALENAIRPSDELTEKVITFLSDTNNEVELEKRIHTAREFDLTFTAPVYTSLIKFYLRQHNHLTAWHYVQEMVAEGHEVPSEIHKLMLKELLFRKRFATFRSYTAWMHRDGSYDTDSQNMMLNRYKLINHKDKMLRFFNDMQVRNVESYHIILSYYANNKAKRTMEEYWDRMIAEGIKPLPLTFQIMLKIIFKWHMDDEIFMWFKKMEEYGLKPTHLTYHNAIEHCMTVGRQDLAWRYYHYFESVGVPLDDCVKGRLRRLKMFRRGKVIDPATLSVEDRQLSFYGYHMTEKNEEPGDIYQ